LTERAPLEVHLDECSECWWELERLQRKSALPRAIWRARFALGNLGLLEAVSLAKTISQVPRRAFSRVPSRVFLVAVTVALMVVLVTYGFQRRSELGAALDHGVPEASPVPSGFTSAGLPARGSPCFTERGANDFSDTRGHGAGQCPDGDRARPPAAGGWPACRGGRPGPAHRRSEAPGGTECPMGDGPHEGRADRAGDGGREAGPRLTSEVSMCSAPSACLAAPALSGSGFEREERSLAAA